MVSTHPKFAQSGGRLTYALNVVLLVVIPLMLVTSGVFSDNYKLSNSLGLVIPSLLILALILRSTLALCNASKENRVLVTVLLALLAICIGIQQIVSSNQHVRMISALSILILAAVVLVSSDITERKLTGLGRLTIYAIGCAQLFMFLLQNNVLDPSLVEANDRFVGTYTGSGGAAATYVVGLALFTFAWDIRRRSVTVVCYVVFGCVCFWTENRAGFLLEALAAFGALLFYFIKNVRLGEWARATAIGSISGIVLLTGVVAAFGINPGGGMMPGVGRFRDVTQVVNSLQGLSSPGEGYVSSMSREVSTGGNVTCGLTKVNQWPRVMNAELNWIANGKLSFVLIGVGGSPVTFLPTPVMKSNSFKVCANRTSSTFLSPNSTAMSILAAYGLFGLASLSMLLWMSIKRVHQTLSTPQIMSLLIPLITVLLASDLIESTIILSSVLICLVGIDGKPGWGDKTFRTVRGDYSCEETTR
jgi:hypothetical protein